MKTLVSLSMALVVAATMGAQTTAPGKPPVKIDLAAPAAQAAPKAATKQDAKKKKAEEPPAKVAGVAVSRGTGFLGVQLVDSKFKVTFYDAKKKPVAPDVARAVVRWNVKYQPEPERALLTPGGDAHSLTSAKIVRAPYTFRLTLILLKGANDGAAEDSNPETFLVDFSQ
jgi:hypothetical protein